MAQEESKTTGHQFKSDTLDATPTARMSGEAHLSLCKGGQIPHSTRKRGVLKHHHFSTSVPQILQKNSSCTTRSLFFSQHIRLFSVAVLPGWENYFEYTATLDEFDQRHRNSKNKLPLSPDRGTTRPTKKHLTQLLLVQEGLQEQAPRTMRKRAQHEVLHIVLTSSSSVQKGPNSFPTRVLPKLVADFS